MAASVTRASSGGAVSASAAAGARDLVVVVSRVRRRLKQVATAQDLTPSQVSVLSRLTKDGPATASEIAGAERVRPQSIAATLAVLRDRKMITRRADPADGRQQLISASAAGRQLIDGTRQARQDWLMRALQERCTEAERVVIIDALAILDRVITS